MVGTADRVLVVLDDHQRVSFRLELGQRVEQDAVVACVQADRRFVEDVTHAAQIGPQLRRDSNALRLAPGKRGRGAIEREIAQAHVVEKFEPGLELGDDVTRDGRLATVQIQLCEESPCFADREPSQVGDRLLAKAHGERLRIEPLTVTRRADPLVVSVPLVPPDFLAGLVGVEAAELQARAEARGAPAMLGVEREQARVEFRKAAAAHGTGALGGENSSRVRLEFRCTAFRRSGRLRKVVSDPIFRKRQRVDVPLSELERAREPLAQCALGGGTDDEARHGQLDRVLLEAVESRPARRGKHCAVDAQLGKALARRPLREVGVVTLAGNHQRREQREMATGVVAQQFRRDSLFALRRDRRVVIRTVLRADLDVEQPQEMIDLGECGDRALAPAAAGALLDRHRWRNAEDRVDLRT